MVTGERGMFVAELLQQELTFYENDARAEGWSSLDTLVGVMEGDMTRFAIPREEPLAAELRAFLDLVAGHQSPTLASALDGLAAITIAEAMLRSAESGMAVSGGLLTGST